MTGLRSSVAVLSLTLFTGCPRSVPAPQASASPQVARSADRPAQLLAIARLPADTFAPGPPSGSHFTPEHGAPFSSQPVQGFSALLLQPDGGFLVLADNGYGSPETSADFLLRAYSLAVDFDAGTIAPALALQLRDPDRLVPWPITNSFTSERLLTGADLDPESLVRVPGGGFWVGDEHGPFLLHLDDTGKLLAPPFALTELDGGLRQGPDNPFLTENLLLRSLEALRAHARAHGAKDPWLSPEHTLLTGAAQVKQLHIAGFKVVPWTVNDPRRAQELISWQVDGLISDRPDLLPRDGGLDVQGHRGARGLEPESTLPAFETALDVGVTTLELDLTATRDGVLVWHDERMSADKCRPSTPGAPASVLESTSAALTSQWTCDGLLRSSFAEQRATVTPVAAAFAAERGLKSPFAPVTLGQLLDFVRAYETYYAGGPGKRARVAAQRLATVRTVRLNLETKVHPSSAREQVEWLTDKLSQAVSAPAWRDRVSLQSFDWRSVVRAHEKYPWLQTVVLLDDETMAAPAERRAGLPWPRRPRGEVQLQRSGGFESLALAPDGKRLVALVEKPLTGEGQVLRAYSFDLAAQRFTGLAFTLPLHPRAMSIADITLFASSGYGLERDDTDGAADGYKRLVRFELPSKPGGEASRTDAADLVHLKQADGSTFSFSFVTIEGVAVLPDGTVAIVNDNNYPFGHARPGPVDGTELILVAPQRR